MNTIIANGRENINFDKIKLNEHFIYSDCGIELFAIKVSENYAVFINADGKFTCAKAYKNCLTLGPMAVREFSTFDEAVKNCNDDIVGLAEKSFAN